MALHPSEKSSFNRIREANPDLDRKVPPVDDLTVVMNSSTYSLEDLKNAVNEQYSDDEFKEDRERVLGFLEHIASAADPDAYIADLEKSEFADDQVVVSLRSPYPNPDEP